MIVMHPKKENLLKTVSMDIFPDVDLHHMQKVYEDEAFDEIVAKGTSEDIGAAARRCSK